MASRFSCYICSKDLSNFPKDRVIIRQKTNEYVTLYDLAVNVIQSTAIEVPAAIIHDKLDGMLCKSCLKCLSQFCKANKAIEPFKKKLNELFVVS